ncbi:MAG: hypothetical protein ACOCQR_03820 [bacterium]
MSKILKRIQGKHVSDEREEKVCNSCSFITEDLTVENCPHCQKELSRQRMDYGRNIPTRLIVECDCGRELEIWTTSFTTTCECGADYSGDGSRLRDREDWGEETGELASDILRG